MRKHKFYIRFLIQREFHFVITFSFLNRKLKNEEIITVQKTKQIVRVA